MATKPAPRYTVTNCNVTNTTAPTNEYTADAVIALSGAATALAVAIEEIAKALRGGDVRMTNGMKFGGDDD